MNVLYTLYIQYVYNIYTHHIYIYIYIYICVCLCVCVCVCVCVRVCFTYHIHYVYIVCMLSIYSVRQWPKRSVFSPRSSHTNDSNNAT